MKRVFSLLFLFIMCSVFCFTSFGNTLVSAGEQVEVASDDAVYKLEMTNTKGAIGAIMQVHQYYKKSGTSGVDSSKKYDSTNVYKGEGGSKIYEKPLTDEGALAVLYITKEGDVLMASANDVEIVNVRFYYLVAKSKDENSFGAFCPTGVNNYILCENARSVQPGNNGVTLWKNDSKSGPLVYTQSTFINAFDVKEEVNSTIYKGLNLFDALSAAYKDVVKDSGMYVIATMTVKYQDKEYMINNYAVDNTNFKFDAESNASTDPINNNLTLHFELMNDNRYVTGSHTIVTSSHTTNPLSYLAALIAPVSESSSDEKKNASIREFERFWNETLRPIMIFAIGILFVIVGTSTGVTIVKSSDEPEVRREAIKKLIGLFVGAFIIEVILIFSEDIVNIVRSFIK